MLITLFTDASYCSRSRVAAYAAWAKADGRTVRHSGVFRQPVPNSSMAETMALVNGIHLAIAAMRPPPASKIIAQTDCVGAIQALSGLLRRAQVIRQYETVVAAFRDKVAASSVVVEFRHVGGHRGTATPRNAVNTWCDGECRRLMRAARAELLGARKPAVAALAAQAAAVATPSSRTPVIPAPVARAPRAAAPPV